MEDVILLSLFLCAFFNLLKTVFFKSNRFICVFSIETAVCWFYDSVFRMANFFFAKKYNKHGPVSKIIKI